MSRLIFLRHKHTWALVPWCTRGLQLPLGLSVRWVARTCTDKGCSSHWTDKFVSTATEEDSKQSKERIV